MIELIAVEAATERVSEKHKRGTRNWREYSEKLVKRDDFYLNLDFLKSWSDELEQMNKGKV